MKYGAFIVVRLGR